MRESWFSKIIYKALSELIWLFRINLTLLQTSTKTQ